MPSCAAAANIVFSMLCRVSAAASSGCRASLPMMDVLCAAHRKWMSGIVSWG